MSNRANKKSGSPLDELKKQERVLFDTYSNHLSYQGKIDHLEKMVKVLKQIKQLTS